MSKSPATGRASEPTSAQLRELFAQIESGRVTKERLQEFLRGKGLNFPSYTVPVNYDLTVEQLVQAGGYDWVGDGNTSAHFPLNESGQEQVEIFVMPIAQIMSTEVVIANMVAFELQRPNVKQGLSLGVHCPDLQREGPIVILCEPWRRPGGSVFVPCLNRDGSNRYLHLGWVGSGWHPAWRFAAVRRSVARSSFAGQVSLST